MKFRKDIIVEWCAYCKGPINIKDGVVIDKKGDCYHLECYHLLNGFPMEFGDNEIEDMETNE